MSNVMTKTQKEADVNIVQPLENGEKMDKRDDKGRFVVGYEGGPGRPQGSRSPSVETIAKWGLTPELITSSLVEDIVEKPQKRVEELKLGAKILKMTDEEVKSEPPELHVHYHEDKIVQLVQKAEEEIIKQLDEKIGS